METCQITDVSPGTMRLRLDTACLCPHIITSLGGSYLLCSYFLHEHSHSWVFDLLFTWTIFVVWKFTEQSKVVSIHNPA